MLAGAILGSLVLLGEVAWILRSTSRRAPTPDQATELARETADLLQQGLRVADSHAYYCGMGIEWADGLFVYDAVQDGDIASSNETALHSDRRREFRDPAEFRRWLAEEMLKHPPGPTSEISYWRVRSHVDAFKRSLLPNCSPRMRAAYPDALYRSLTNASIEITLEEHFLAQPGSKAANLVDL